MTPFFAHDCDIAPAVKPRCASYQLLDATLATIATAADLLPRFRGDVDLPELARKYVGDGRRGTKMRPCIIVRALDDRPIMVFGPNAWRLVGLVESRPAPVAINAMGGDA